MPGHPDWQGYAQWMGDPLTSVKGQSIPTAGVTLGPFHVDHFRSVLFAVNNLTVDLILAISSFFTGAAGISMYVTEQKIWSGFQSVINLPVYGNRVSLFLRSLDAAGGTADVQLSPNNFDPGYRSINQFRQLAVITGLVIGVGGSQNILIPPYAGRCHYVFYSAQAGANFYIAESDINKNVVFYNDIVENVAAATPIRGDVVLGTGLNIVKITNTSAGNVSVHVGVYGDYAQQGDF